MCDLSPIYAAITAIDLAIIAALVSCGIAIAMNLGIITAPGAPIAFGIALACGTIAAIACAPVVSMISGSCAAAPCAAEAEAAMSWFAVIGVTIAAGLVIGYVAAIIAGAPGPGAGAMALYAGALVIAAAALPEAIAKVRALEACLAAPPPPVAGVAYVLGIAASAIAIVGGVLLILLGGRADRPHGPND